MHINSQNHIIGKLEEKISALKIILGETIEKHSDAAYDLKDLKVALEEISGHIFEPSSEKMLVMANEWEDVK